MKILFVVNNFNFGGPQKSLLNLLYELEETDIEIDLMILNQQDELTKYLPSYVNVKPVDSKFSVLMLNKSNLIRSIFKNLNHPILVWKALTFVLKSKLNLHDNTKAKQQFWVKNKWKNNKIKKHYDYAIGVSGGHSVYFIEDYINADYKIGWIRTDYRVLKRNHKIDQKYFNKMTGMLAVSSMCANIFKDIFNIEPLVFYNSLPIKLYANLPDENFIINSKTLNIATICRLDNGKGLDLLIETATILKKRGLQFNWYVVGDGKLKDWLDNAIKDKELENNVIPLGFRFNTGSIVQKMDILVHPSRFEGKSNTIDEALYYNIPVVATNFETVYEQITDGQTGFIVEMKPEFIASKIEMLSQHRAKLIEIKNNLSGQSKDQVSKGQEFISTINKVGN
ncbi:glycosyltransferase [Staphylococcus saccharolyticus]|uniref:Putative glycosyltransferase n=1 Tax=Staphylococcus saccharolyticus TaxID=33028 RepID=A0A380H062_9STAP|nr:glycosyltransferase [Staphylococcus saccharolyticus]MBL7564627.1 glycosyltransferase [Staphylococcus saccharolyticus]MBL7571109.1 glycosyltransferase [Staphylococcus saccharolyticus]QQB98955.1 glycosyltransferase [Staphylococcus saccharolyticus]QRJ66832.1 glycosyltransferase [Staphylococcus saccharolyticus]RTX98430.1 glycosyltransferase [Staphylococcus saccharolyticus]